MKKLLLESMQKMDFIIWGITLIFFIFSAIFTGGNINESFVGASGIIILMFFVGFSIELILSTLKNINGLGKITGFITNGPEALVLIVGLIKGNILFAASTPLGSNVMNPILLLIGIIISGYFFKLKKFKYKYFFLYSFLVTAFFATIFFYFQERYYIYWIIFSFISATIIFLRKYDNENINKKTLNVNKFFLPFGIIILLIAGYFLDPVVSFTASASNAPKGLIGFVILSTLTSWPEFKSVLALLKINRPLDAFINILVSNLTNIWLAIIGIIFWLFTK